MAVIPHSGWINANAVLSCHTAILSVSWEIILGNNYGQVCSRKDVQTIHPGSASHLLDLGSGQMLYSTRICSGHSLSNLINPFFVGHKPKARAKSYLLENLPSWLDLAHFQHYTLGQWQPNLFKLPQLGISVSEDCRSKQRNELGSTSGFILSHLQNPNHWSGCCDRESRRCSFTHCARKTKVVLIAPDCLLWWP